MNIIQTIMPWVAIIIITLWLFRWGGLATVGGWLKAIADKFGSTLTVVILGAFAAFVILAISAPKMLQWAAGDIGPFSVVMSRKMIEEIQWENMTADGVDYTLNPNPILSEQAKAMVLQEKDDNAELQTSLTEREAELACAQLPSDRDLKWATVNPCERINTLANENIADFKDEADGVAKEIGESISAMATPVLAVLAQPIGGQPPGDANGFVRQLYYLPMWATLLVFVGIVAWVKAKKG